MEILLRSGYSLIKLLERKFYRYKFYFLHIQEKDPIFFDRLHESLQILSEFFFADGRGIMGPKLYTPNFNRLDIEFSLNGVSKPISDANILYNTVGAISTLVQ